jgi:hypothetical protein
LSDDRKWRVCNSPSRLNTGSDTILGQPKPDVGNDTQAIAVRHATNNLGKPEFSAYLNADHGVNRKRPKIDAIVRQNHGSSRPNL